MDSNELKKENKELKEIIKEDAKQSHITGNFLKLVIRICIITNCLWFALFVVTVICTFTYYYKTEPIPYNITTDVTQDGLYNNHSIQSSNDNIEFIDIDLTNKGTEWQDKELKRQ